MQSLSVVWQLLPLLLLYLAVLFALAYPLGLYLSTFINRQPLACMQQVDAKVLPRCGVRLDQSMNWKQYLWAMVGFNLLGVGFLYVLQLLQEVLPLNPMAAQAPTWHSALNTAVSFVTNTNWQGYAGETAMSYSTQMVGLTVQNFLSAASGIAVALVLIRALTQSRQQNVGNAWVDLWRINLYVLLPLSVVLALLLMGQGVIQNFAAPVQVSTLEGATQTLPMGPVASQEAIKMIGTNGGGFFNANSAHPFENPTPLSNFLQMLAIFWIPAALCVAFGKAAGNLKQGLSLLAAMTMLFVTAVLVVGVTEAQGHPALTALLQTPLDSTVNWEGKETRFGLLNSALFVVITTAASCGAVNTMHASLTPLGGVVPTVLMQLGEVVFGGVGSGLYGMLLFACLAVFVAGLMIGRTPEYLGKKIEPFDMKMVVIGLLISPLLVLLGTAVAVVSPAGVASMLNPSSHGFAEVLYAFSSAANNNGSAFAGLSANTPFYNLMLTVAMGVGRFGVMAAVLGLAGNLIQKPRLAVTSGTLATDDGLFVGLLVGAVVLLGALTFIPALALAGIVEQLWMVAG